jgi:hypothetical protein
VETLEDEYSINRVLDPSQPSESHLECGAHNLMTEGESVDCRYRLVSSNVTIRECVTSVRVETRLRKERETCGSKRT